jgi:hypothetical protein
MPPLLRIPVSITARTSENAGMAKFAELRACELRGFRILGTRMKKDRKRIRRKAVRPRPPEMGVGRRP